MTFMMDDSSLSAIIQSACCKIAKKTDIVHAWKMTPPMSSVTAMSIPRADKVAVLGKSRGSA